MSAAQAFRVEQLWLDVDRPLQTRVPRGGRKRAIAGDRPASDRQMEFRMLAPARAPAVQPAIERPAPTPESASEPMAKMRPGPLPDSVAVAAPFGTWLLKQTKQRGSLGHLARAAKLDRLFPGRGDVDAVRARFSAAGADGDAFAALDDAEREYWRATA